MNRSRSLPLLLALAAYALAFAQRPGELVADTKIDLHVAPVSFLTDAASIWSFSGGLGQVQAGQYAGYLFPMGPFFALGDLIGLAPWLIHRLWIGAVLAVAAWGTVKLIDATLGRPGGVAHVVAGLAVVLNPYVVVFLDRTSVTLLGYAALPWLLLAVLRAAREPAGWRWPAVFALVLAATGGGVNAAVTAWLLLAPLMLAVHEVARRHVTARQMAAVGARTAVLSVVASAWWIVPVAEHAAHGLNFLPFTETVGAIWGTTSMSESLRLLGYWIVYLGTGYGAAPLPYFSTGGTLLFEPLAVLATLLLPALALGGFAVTRRWRYGPFFLALVLLGALVMSAGFPEGAPLRRVLTGIYNAAEPVQFMRTTYKAGPLVALGIACLLGAAAGRLWSTARGGAVVRGAGAVALAAVLLGASWPVVQGRAIDDQIAFDEVPEAWRAAAADLDGELPPGTRALVLPGQLFPFYRWGTTQDPVLPALTERPTAVRGAVPFADLHAADLLVAVDSLVQQRRLLPRQLPPLLDLMGVGAVVTGADDDLERSGSIPPTEAAALLASQPGLGGADERYGWVEDRGLPRVRRYDRPDSPGTVRVLPRRGALVVDGSAEGLAGLAALGALPRDRAVRYAGDLAPAEIRAAVAAGGEVVVTDTNRRRTFLSSRHRQNVGPVLAADDSPPEDAAVLDPFGDRGTDAQTVAVLRGARSIEAPLSPNFPQFPEHRPFAAFDGDPSTYWVADRYIERDRRWIEVDFGRPRDVAVVRLLPQRETATRVTAVEIAGRRHALRLGWNTLRTDLSDLRRLRVRIASVHEPDGRAAGAGAIAEIRVPGLRVEERLRPPRLTEDALGAAVAPGTLSYLFQRVTGDDPFRRSRWPDPDRGSVPRDANAEAPLVAQPGDQEESIRRTFELPGAMRTTGEGWASVVPAAPDDTLDRLAGYAGSTRMTSSDRYRNAPANRASSAFDGDADTAWVGAGRGGSAPWIAWRTAAPSRLGRLTLEAALGRGGRPTRVRIRGRSGWTPPLPVGPRGEVKLPRPIVSRAFRLEVVATRGARGRSADTAAIAELSVPGVEPVELRRTGALRAPCGLLGVRLADGRLPMRVEGRVTDLDSGRPLRASACGEPVSVARGRVDLDATGAVVRLDVLRLRDARAAAARTAPEVGGVVDPGEEGHGSRTGVRVDVTGPAWLVLGESFNRGWRATCDGRDLGAPEVVNGYANGWPVERGCREAAFEYAPNGVANWSYALSGAGVAAMLAVLAAGARRRRRSGRGTVVEPSPSQAFGDPPDHAPSWPLRRAAIAGIAMLPAAALLFSIRAGLAITPLVALVLWRGIGARALALAAGGLLGIAVPAIQLGWLPEDRGGFNGSYATEVMAAHWVAVAAWVLLALALWRTLSTARGRRDVRARERADAARPRSRA